MMKYDLAKVRWKATQTNGIIDKPEDYGRIDRNKLTKFELIYEDKTILEIRKPFLRKFKVFARLRSWGKVKRNKGFQIEQRLWVVGINKIPFRTYWIIREDGRIIKKNRWGKYYSVVLREDEK